MLKKITDLFFSDGNTPFETYYSRLLLSDRGQWAPSYREARTDYRNYHSSLLKSISSNKVG